ncbi:MAG: 2-polyprenylphenol 6-hydroxylase [Parvularculales bacterium]
MITALGHIVRLVRAGWVLLRYDALFPVDDVATDLPSWTQAIRRLVVYRDYCTHASSHESPHGATRPHLSTALQALGPAYIKLGQFLATRPDIIGEARAADLSLLQDKLPPFPQDEARHVIATALGQPVDELFETFGPPVAAASIAQVHKAYTSQGPVAVKVLRPGIERALIRDMESFAFAAHWLERLSRSVRRLRPVDVAATLIRSVTLEMDLRLEAAAMSEMADNVRDDTNFRTPTVDWSRTTQRVITMEWIEATPASDTQTLINAGQDMPALATRVIQSFLLHALRDGFFHADMHQGNLFIEPDGTVVAVDFGIMGRLNTQSRFFLAEILYGFIIRDYHRVARVHFEAGYVPANQDTDAFSQALRAIGEPIMDKSATEISMAGLLMQLFQVTAQFNMETQPQLVLLQKTMVVVEGLARTFHPGHNMWVCAEPVVSQWMQEHMGLGSRLRENAETISDITRHLPEWITRIGRITRLLDKALDEEGLRVHPSSLSGLSGLKTPEQNVPRQKAGLWLFLAVFCGLLGGLLGGLLVILGVG